VEGRSSSAAVTRWPDGVRYFSVNGHVQATTEIYDMRLQRMVAHLPGVLHPDPRSVLGIGFGAGVSAGSFTRYPGITRITICEIEPVIPPGSLDGLPAVIEQFGDLLAERDNGLGERIRANHLLEAGLRSLSLLLRRLNSLMRPHLKKRPALLAA